MIDREKFSKLTLGEKRILGNLLYHPDWEDENDPDENLIKALENAWSGDPRDEHEGGADRFIEIVKKL